MLALFLFPFNEVKDFTSSFGGIALYMLLSQFLEMIDSVYLGLEKEKKEDSFENSKLAVSCAH